MAVALDSGKIVEKIIEGSGKDREEILAVIEAKKKKFSGLLTDNAAALMVARELGVEIDAGSRPKEKVTIALLKPGMGNVELAVRAMHIFSQKKFEKGSRKGVLCSLIVADGSGETRLAVWNRDALRIGEEKLERGCCLFLKNCHVTEFNGKNQLNLGYGGQMITNTKTDPELPEPKSRPVKLGELKKEMQNVDVFGKVTGIFGEMEFNSKGRHGVVMNFGLADETSSVVAVAWNDVVDSAKKLNSGDLVKIEGAYTKEGLGGIELHLGWQARVIPNPRGIEISGVEAVTNRKSIAELRENQAAQLKASIVELYMGNLHYLVCPECKKKLEKLEGGFVCSACGEVKEPGINLVVNLAIDDGSASTRAVFFGKTAEEAIGLSKDGLKKMLEGKTPGEIIAEIKPGLIGKELLIEGIARKNPATQEMEFVARRLGRIDHKKEAEGLLKEPA